MRLSNTFNFGSPGKKQPSFNKYKKIESEIDKKKILKALSVKDKRELSEYLKDYGAQKSIYSVSRSIEKDTPGFRGKTLKKRFIDAAKNYYFPKKEGLTKEQKIRNIRSYRWAGEEMTPAELLKELRGRGTLSQAKGMGASSINRSSSITKKDSSIRFAGDLIKDKEKKEEESRPGFAKRSDLISPEKPKPPIIAPPPLR